MIRANRAGTAEVKANDVAIDGAGEVCMALRRYHDVLINLAGRKTVRDDPTRYEALGMAMVSVDIGNAGQLLADFPPVESPLRPENFFTALLSIYDLRFPYVAASVRSLRRMEWSSDSPIFSSGGVETVARFLGYLPRVAGFVDPS